MRSALYSGIRRFISTASGREKVIQVSCAASDADGDNAALGGSSDADLEGGGSVRARVANAV